jgi:hypothetical protein
MRAALYSRPHSVHGDFGRRSPRQPLADATVVPRSSKTSKQKPNGVGSHAATPPEWSILTQRGVGISVVWSLNPGSFEFAQLVPMLGDKRGVSVFLRGFRFRCSGEAARPRLGSSLTATDRRGWLI